MEAATYEALRRRVLSEHVVPDLEASIQHGLASRRRWARAAHFSEGAAHVCLGVSTILAFSSGFFDQRGLAFAAACSNTLCIVLMRYASYAVGESVERTELLNRHLAALGLRPALDVAAPVDRPAVRESEV
jgi:hypothetical protein